MPLYSSQRDGVKTAPTSQTGRRADMNRLIRSSTNTGDARPGRLTTALLLLATVIFSLIMTAGGLSAVPAWQSGGDFELRCYDVRAEPS